MRSVTGIGNNAADTPNRKEDGMQRRREAAGSSTATATRLSTAVLIELTSVVSLPVRGALEDTGLHVIPRHSFNDLERVLPYNAHTLVVLSVDEIEPGHVDRIAAIRACTDVPIIVVSETEDLGQRIAAFDAGADEHIAPSARRAEVAARIRARLRRYASSAPSVPHLRLIEPN
jgi:two-component system KDP operon response regulator KdpE